MQEKLFTNEVERILRDNLGNPDINCKLSAYVYLQLLHPKTSDIIEHYVNHSDSRAKVEISNIDDINTEITNLYRNTNDVIEEKLESGRDIRKKSGLIELGISYIHFTVIKQDRSLFQLRGASTFSIPRKYMTKYGVSNPKNEDDYCLIWCILIHRLVNEKRRDVMI